jgi:hypothetical protein
MGRQATAEELLAQAEANGYKRGVHKHHDQVKHREKYVKKTVRNQDDTMLRPVCEGLPLLSFTVHRARSFLES